MLNRNTLAFVAIVAAGLPACVTESTDTDIPINSGGSGNATSTGGTGGAGAAGAAGGMGGMGGAGAAGGGTCVAEGDGTMEYLEEDCNDLTAAPSCAGGVSSVCLDAANGDYYPPAWQTCRRGLDIFHDGALDVLMSCLGEIGTNPEACDTDVANGCIGEMYGAVCDNPDADAWCDAVNDSCTSVGDNDFNVDGCKADLKPFSAQAVELIYIDCQNELADAGDPCADAHEICIADALSYYDPPLSCDEAPF